MALALDLTSTMDETDIVNDKRAGGDRHSPWMASLAEIAEAVFDGTLPTGKYVKLAQFGAASGARARQKQLAEIELPFGENGKYAFKPNTWIGEDGKRHSTLWAKFDAVSAPARVSEVEEYEEEVV